MNNLSQALHTSLLTGIPLLILWSAITLLIIISQKTYIKRAKKFCISENAIRTTGIVNNLNTRYHGDSNSPNYYAAYVFYTSNGEQIIDEYGLKRLTDYKEGLPVTIYYDKNNPVKNVCVNDLEYMEKLVHVYYKIIVYGALFILGIVAVVFLIQVTK